MKTLCAIVCVLSVLCGCETTSTADAGTACYNSDNQVDSTYKSPFECKKGGGTWK